MHVVMVVPYFHPDLRGGTEIQLARVAPLLARQGTQITVLTKHTRWDAPWTEEWQGCRIVRFPGKGKGLIVGALLWLWSHRREVDLLHSFHLGRPATVGCWARRLWRIPHVTKIVLMEHRRPGLIPRLVGDVDRFIAISRLIERELVEMGVPRSKIVYRPNGVDVTSFCPVPPTEREAIRAGLGWAPGETIVFTAGRICRQKGYDVLLDAWRVLEPDFHFRVRLVLAGQGEWLRRLRRRSRGLPNVQWLGFTKDIHRYLQGADLYVQPSRAEGLSNAVLEAMACGLPVLATAVSGNPDVIESGINGILIPPEEVDALRNALAALLSGQADRQAMGEKARATIGRGFSLVNVAEDYKRLYRELAGRRQ